MSIFFLFEFGLLLAFPGMNFLDWWYIAAVCCYMSCPSSAEVVAVLEERNYYMAFRSD